MKKLKIIETLVTRQNAYNIAVLDIVNLSKIVNIPYYSILKDFIDINDKYTQDISDLKSDSIDLMPIQNDVNELYDSYYEYDKTRIMAHEYTKDLKSQLKLFQDGLAIKMNQYNESAKNLEAIEQSMKRIKNSIAKQTDELLNTLGLKL
jgi:hypothetical protein